MCPRKVFHRVTNKHSLVLIVVIVTGVTAVSAQSPMLIDQLLEADPAPLSLSAELLVFIATQTGVLPGGSSEATDSPDTPFSVAREAGLFPASATDPAAPTEVGTVSLALVEAFELHSGWLYPLQRNPRRAMRELDYRGVLPKGATAQTPVSGELLLRLVSAVIAWESTYGAMAE